MLKKIFKNLIYSSIILSLILAGCAIDTGREEVKHDNEEVSNSLDQSQPMKTLSQKTFFSLKQTYTHVAPGNNGFIYCLANGDNEYINSSKGYGKNHRLHVRKINGKTLYVPRLQYNFGTIWTHMDATEGYLVMYAKYQYDSEGNNFRVYSINSNGSLTLKSKYRYRQYWDEIKISWIDLYIRPGIDLSHPYITFLHDLRGVNFKLSYIKPKDGTVITEIETEIDRGFTSIMSKQDRTELDIYFYKKYDNNDTNLYYSKFSIFESIISNPEPYKELPSYLSDIHFVDSNKLNKFFFVKSGSAFRDKSHLKMYNWHPYKHEKSYLKSDDDKGWDNITNNGEYVIVHKSSQYHENKRNFMIAKIVK